LSLRDMTRLDQGILMPRLSYPVVTEARALAPDPAGLRTDLLSAKSPSGPVRRHVASVKWRRGSERQTSVRSSLEPAHIGRRHEQSRWRYSAVKAWRPRHVTRSRSRNLRWTWREDTWGEIRRKHSRDWSVARIAHHVDAWWRDHGSTLRRHLRRAAHLELGNVVV